MNDNEKTKEQLISELVELRQEKHKRKKVDKAAKQREDRLGMLFEFAPDAYYLNDWKGVFLDGNKAAEDLLGYKKEELIGSSFLKLNLLPSNQIFKAANLLVRNTLGKSTGPDELTIIRKDGGHVSVEIRTHPIKLNNETVVLGIARDITERKRAEEKERQQSEFTNSIIESLDHPFYVINAKDYTIDMANSASGLTETTDSTTCYALTHNRSKPCSSDEHECPLEKVKKTKKPTIVEHIHIDKNGEPLFIEVHGFPILDNEGNVAQMIEYNLDITERKEAEQELQESEKKFKAIFDGSVDGLILADPENKTFLLCNDAICEMLGYTMEELGKLSVVDIHPKKNLPHIITQFERQARREIKIAEDLPVRRKDGSVFYADINSFPVKMSGRIYSMGIFRNITERKEANEKLRDSEERFRTLVETTTDWIWQVNTKGKYIYASPKVKEMLGYEPEEVIGKTRLDLMPSEEAERVGKLFGEYVSAQKPFENIESINIHKERRKVILETSGAPFFDSEGNLAGYTGIDRDVTKRKQLEEQLQIRQRMDSLGTLAGGIAHDFNNLLAGILGYAGLLRSEEGLTDNQTEYADEILKSGQRAADLVTRIQTLSRGSISEKTSVDVYELTKDVFGILSQTTDILIEKQISLKPKTRYVHGSYDELHQVFLNLGTNAVRAIEERGLRAKDYIRVRAEEFDAGKSNRANLPEGKYIHIFFEDNGKGMSDETRKQAFDPLFTTRRGTNKGTGLGLAMVYTIVTANHNGFIDIQSSEGQSTTVHIYLPKAEQKEQAQVKEEIKLAEGTGTVLVIEDELSLLNLARKVLERQGYDVLTAVDGQDGIDKYAEHKEVIDLVLLDITMPKLPGSVVLEKITAMDPKARVIISSGQSDEDMAELSSAMGYLRKPYQIKDLVQTVSSILNPT